MLIGIGGRRVAVLVLACATLVVAFLALDGPLGDGGDTIEASETASEDLTDTAETATTLDPSAPEGPAAASAKAAVPALAVKTDEQLTAPADQSGAATTVAAEGATTTTTAEDSVTETTAGETATAEDPQAPTTTPAPPSGNKPVIHLTFDDGPSELTPRVMDLVEKYNGRATFFVMGSAVEDHPDIAREIVERGHAIANHSYDHMDWRQPGAREDAIRTQEIIQTATGVTPSCARPPFGAQDENLLSILSSLGMETWRWDLSAEDHTEARYQVEQTLNTIDQIQNIRGAEGKIFLQHDSDLLVGPSIDGLESWLAKNGDRYEFKVIDNCLNYQ